ncbi:MAG: HAD-IB family hydrolase [Treponema sp.]|jgi:HAD superfamily hydrolase (TIGR01490 family)|nr:HAD-IB family hydrolase [Treponema sp.]
MTVHLFDVDYTLIRKSTAHYFLSEGLREGVFSFRQFKQLPFEWLRYKLGRANHDFIEQAVAHLAGIERSAIDRLAQSCFERKLKDNVYAEGLALIRDIHNQGEPALLATSSFYSLVQPLERFLGLGESLASHLEFADGKTTGRIQGKVLFGQNKKEAVEAWVTARGILPANVRFYSDSYTDLSTLKFCGQPVAVNPDRFLAREAKRRGWEILWWGN